MEALGVDFKLLTAQGVNFLLFFLIFKKFIAKPFHNFLLEQKREEAEKERILREVEETKEKVKELERETLDEAKKQAVKIINDAKKEAITVKNKILKEAQTEALEIKKRTKKELEAERDKLFKEMKLRFVDMSVAMLKKVLTGFISKEKQKEVIQYLFNQLPEDMVDEN